jgi:hypothetical protein
MSFMAQCPGIAESTFHALRDCPRVAQVWSHLVNQCYMYDFFIRDYSSWLNFNLTHNAGGNSSRDWIGVWGLTCYHLWRWSNLGSHYSSFIWPHTPRRLIYKYYNEYCCASSLSCNVHI